MILIGWLSTFEKPTIIIQSSTMTKDTHFFNIDILLVLIL